MLCDYQSERHCSKTPNVIAKIIESAITSQNGTAPKPKTRDIPTRFRAITSQNGTAPKHMSLDVSKVLGAITSQNGTAPKPRMIE